MQSKRIRVLFVEDSEADVRLGVRELESYGFALLSRRVSDSEAMQRELSLSPPDAILSDFVMRKFDGMQAIGLARQFTPQVPFIVLADAIGEERVAEAMHLGATDFVLKTNLGRLGSSLERALQQAADRRRLRNAAETVRRSLLVTRHCYQSRTTAADDGEDVLASPGNIEDLTERELQVLRLIVEGKTNAQAGAALHISPRSVETYRARVMKKLEIDHLPGLVKFAIRQGIITIG
jgi:DNA-binding NarL/FixJ family response regulator